MLLSYRAGAGDAGVRGGAVAVGGGGDVVLSDLAGPGAGVELPAGDVGLGRGGSDLAGGFPCAIDRTHGGGDEMVVVIHHK